MGVRMYTITEYEKLTKVPRKTLRRWIENNRLVPKKDSDGKKRYTSEQLKIVLNNFGLPTNGKLLKYEDRWIDFSEVPLVKFSEKYDWGSAILNESKIYFMYKNRNGCIQIKNKNKNMLTIAVDEDIREISTGSLINCNLGEKLGLYSSDFRYEVGQNVKDENFDIVILEKYRGGNHNKKFYKYKCNRCNNILEADEYRIINSISICPVCNGIKVIPGYNDISVTDPWMLKYLTKEVNTERISHGSKQSFFMICPECGRMSKKKIEIKTLYATHSIGCSCSDGYSYPNKYMFNVLEQLEKQHHIRSFNNEWSPSWIGNKRFDFKIEKMDGVLIIIEMDGALGHGRKSIDKNIEPRNLKNIDEWKDRKAKERNIKVYRIPSLISSSEYLSEQITMIIGEIFDLGNIDWNQAAEFAQSNLVKEVCSFYKEHNSLSIDELADHFNIHRSTALRYVKRGEKLGWCAYNYQRLYENRKKSSAAASIASRKSVACYNFDGELIKVYDSIKEASIKENVSTTAIINCCKGKTKKCKNMNWKYL